MPDPVTQPAHYVVNGLECLEVIESLGLGYHLGNVLKYVWRAGRKTEDGVEDLRKAVFYLEREIQRRTAPLGCPGCLLCADPSMLCREHQVRHG